MWFWSKLSVIEESLAMIMTVDGILLQPVSTQKYLEVVPVFDDQLQMALSHTPSKLYYLIHP